MVSLDDLSRVLAELPESGTVRTVTRLQDGRYGLHVAGTGIYRTMPKLHTQGDLAYVLRDARDYVALWRVLAPYRETETSDGEDGSGV